MTDGEERFPPGFTAVRLRERQDAMDHARAHAAQDGAGTIYIVGRFDLIEFAVVLEPEMPLAAARRVLFVGMNALSETIAADALPERTLAFEYPATLLFDDGLIGGARLSWPENLAETDVPQWTVFSVMIRSGGLSDFNFALDSSVTTLEEAGFRDIDPMGFAARFCRHFLREIDEWQSVGFKDVGRRYLSRLGKSEDALRIIEPDGALVVQAAGQGGARQNAVSVAGCRAGLV